MFAKVARELKERAILLAHVVQNADGGDVLASETDDLASRAAKLPLQRLHLQNRRVEMLFEEFLEYVHEFVNSRRDRAPRSRAIRLVRSIHKISSSGDCRVVNLRNRVQA